VETAVENFPTTLADPEDIMRLHIDIEKGSDQDSHGEEYPNRASTYGDCQQMDPDVDFPIESLGQQFTDLDHVFILKSQSIREEKI
jgi:hypothetical protein